MVRALEQVATPDGDWDSNRPDPSTSNAPYRLYNIGNNQPVELLQYNRTLGDCLGKQAAVNLLPLKAGDVADTHAVVSAIGAGGGLPARQDGQRRNSVLC